jgi:hypothetical protein
MKQIKIAEPVARAEQQIIDDIAGESERLGAAEQEFAGLGARRSRMLASGTLEEIHGLADSLARAKLKIEIYESRLASLNGELKRFYAAEAQAAIDAAMAPLVAIDAEEQQALADYETHARLVAEDLVRLRELQGRRHQVSVAVHRLTGTWVSADSPNYRGALAQQVKLPSATGDKDHWPLQSAAILDAAARATRDQAALAEYHRESE